jgi:hypothetical protein
LLRFLKQIVDENGIEVVIQVSYSSKPWHSVHIAFVDERPVDFATIRKMIERLTKKKQ